MNAPRPEGLTVQVVTEDDWELWRELRHRVLTTDPQAFGSTLEREQGYDEATWRARVGRGRAVVAYVEGVAVGMGGIMSEEAGVATVVSMWVAPEQRGRGIGRALLDDVVSAAVAAGLRVRLWVTEDNPARRVYERAGFADTGAREPLRPGAATMKRQMELVAGSANTSASDRRMGSDG